MGVCRALKEEPDLLVWSESAAIDELRQATRGDHRR
jgi:hypothetical protein